MIVRAEARVAVRRFLDASAASDPMAAVADAATAFRTHGTDLVAAFGEAIETETSDRRAVAAWFIMALATQCPEEMSDTGLLRKAETALVEVLERGAEDEQILLCTFLAATAAPESAVEALRALVRPSNGELLSPTRSNLQVLAAAALATVAPDNADAVCALRRGLEDPEPALVAVAALAVSRIGLSDWMPVPHLIRALTLAEPPLKGIIAHAIHQIGPPAIEAVDALGAIALDPTALPVVRRVAATAIGNITKGTEKGTDTLIRALCVPLPELVEGSIEAFSLKGPFPPKAIAAMMTLLSSEDVALRRAAAWGFAYMGPEAGVAAEAMIGRFGVEADAQVIQGLAGSLSHLGPAVLPQLLDILRAQDMTKIAPVALTLIWMGKPAAIGIAQALTGEADAMLRSSLVAIVRDMREDGAPAVPALAELLDDAVEEDDARTLLAAIEATGNGATRAIPALVRALDRDKDEIAAYAERALRNTLPASRRELEAAFEESGGLQRLRLDRVLSQSSPPLPSRFADYEELDTPTLERYLYVANTLEERGPTSFREISMVLEKDRARIGPNASISPRYLLMTVELLEERWGHTLVNRAAGKAGDLTAEGKRRAADVRSYLAAREARRRGR